MTNKKLIGITGGIGAGKTIVCSIIHAMGYPVFSSDKESKIILNTDPEVIEAITALFGDKAYTNEGLNRPYIAEKVFNDRQLLEQINAIAHPAVRKAFDQWALEQPTPIVFNEAAIIFETGGYKQFDANVLVTAPQETRLARVMARDGISAEAVQKRMDKQWTDEEKRKLADFEIVNDGKMMLIPQVIQLIKDIKNA